MTNVDVLKTKASVIGNHKIEILGMDRLNTVSILYLIFLEDIGYVALFKTSKSSRQFLYFSFPTRRVSFITFWELVSSA